MSLCSALPNTERGSRSVGSSVSFCFQSRMKPSKNYTLHLLNKFNQWKPRGKISWWKRTYLGPVPAEEPRFFPLALSTPHVDGKLILELSVLSQWPGPSAAGFPKAPRALLFVLITVPQRITDVLPAPALSVSLFLFLSALSSRPTL